MKNKDFDIGKLVRKISKSDESAFRSLFDFYYPRLLNYAFVIIKNHESADDIVLEVLCTVWEKRAKINDIKNFGSYLYISVRNKTIECIKKNSKLITVSFDESMYDEHIVHSDPENHLLNRELFDLIDQAILNLPEKTRLVYRLVKGEGMKYQEAADLLGISVKTVNNQLLNAMREIRVTVKNYLNGNNEKARLSSSMRTV